MHLQKLFVHTPISMSLIALFLLMIGLQWALGVNVNAPTNFDLMRFGANFLPLSLSSEPWRVVSSGFLHIGFLHLVFNSVAMYYFGQVCELIMGGWRFLALFILSVVGGNILNLSVGWYGIAHGKAPVIAAGASGGIMGIGMMLLVLSFSQHPVAKNLNKTNLLIIMAINLGNGFILPGIDNAGHIGGAVTGLILTMVFIKLPQHYAKACVILMLSFGCVWWWLHAQLAALL